MPDVRTFFRHCPSCGRRFEIRLVSKEEVGDSDVVEMLPHISAIGGVRVGQPTAQTVVEQGRPNVVDVEEFRYNYKCKHCGHAWSELRENANSMGEVKGYTGD